MMVDMRRFANINVSRMSVFSTASPATTPQSWWNRGGDLVDLVLHLDAVKARCEASVGDAVRRDRDALRRLPGHLQYQWRGHECAYVAAGEGPPVILLHGFAGSAYNCWRPRCPRWLHPPPRAYALDLLGPGKSAQPSDATYSIDTWREQVRDFCAEQLDGAPPVVIGHSFGSLVALEVAREAQQAGSPVRAVGMMNCGVGLNNKGALKVEEWRSAQQARGIATEEAAPAWQLAIFGAVLALVDLIFNQSGCSPPASRSLRPPRMCAARWRRPCT